MEIFWVYRVERNALVWSSVQIRKERSEQNGGEIQIVVDELVCANTAKKLHNAYMALGPKVKRVGDITRFVSDDDMQVCWSFCNGRSARDATA